MASLSSLCVFYWRPFTMFNSLLPKSLLLLSILQTATASPSYPRTTPQNSTCTKTKVAILGAGMAGIAAAQSLHNASISDFVIIDVNSYIGGRVAHTKFGTNPSTKQPYTVELGANWVQGLVSDGGPENPIWTLAKKWGLENTYSNYSSIQTYDENGIADYAGLLDDYENAYSTVEQDAGTILTQNLQDRTMRTGLSIADWKPKKDMQMQAAEWWEFDWEYSYSPDQSSQTWAIVVCLYIKQREEIKVLMKVTELQHNILPILRRQQLRLRPTRLQLLHRVRSLYLSPTQRHPSPSQHKHHLNLLLQLRRNNHQRRRLLHPSRLRNLHILPRRPPKRRRRFPTLSPSLETNGNRRHANGHLYKNLLPIPPRLRRDFLLGTRPRPCYAILPVRRSRGKRLVSRFPIPFCAGIYRGLGNLFCDGCVFAEL